ncbi:MAG TPA: DUF5050 domain-containing protein [Streptosporangiaceae bacterium]|nr:DUF5050 domain-containing protein [Streptosporangiaceae bacterium]
MATTKKGQLMSGNRSQPATARRGGLAAVTCSLTRKARRTIIAGATTAALAAGLLAAAAGPATAATLPPISFTGQPNGSFGPAPLGAGQSLTYTVANDTAISTYLTMSITGSTDFSIVGPASTCTNYTTPGHTLLKDETCTVVVRFAPTTLGPVTAQLNVTASVGGNVFVSLSGTGYANLIWSNVVSYMTPQSGTLAAAVVNGSTTTLRESIPGQSEPAGIAADSSHLYWAGYGNGTIMESNRDGSNPHAIVSGQNMPWGMAVNSNHLYWTDLGGGTVMEANLDGTGAQVIETGQAYPAGITLDGSHLYWADYSSGLIMKANLDGSNPQAIVSGRRSPMGVAVTSSHIYWTEFYNGTVMDANLDGTSVQQIAYTVGRPAGIVVDAGTLFWVDEDNMTADQTSGMINAANLDGSNVRTLISGQPLPWGLLAY